ncbi:MAG TPA: Ppx/GppA phosphatase family protein [Pyrinomonadaceae bacterium]|jgi:exopolyphosphatase/guanosine-5'-triphosphate,3'-diphosphate pyrophosphatase
MKTQIIAAIDIGSNSLKLAVIEAAASDSFTVILQERERIRLGCEIMQDKCLSQKAIDVSADAVAKFRSIAESRRADALIAVATAAVREAPNAAEFVGEIKRRTGVSIEVLSSLEEARLIGIAAAQNCEFNEGALLNVDIGGGSTELSLMRDGEPHRLFSMKLGAVGLTEKFIASDPPREKEIENLRAEIAGALERPRRVLKSETWQKTSGTSGTILNLSALLNFQDGAAHASEPVIELKKLAAFNEMLRRMTLEERRRLPVVSPQRAGVIVAGGLILEDVMRALCIEALTPCGYALREGVLIDHLREIEAEKLPRLPDVEDRRLRGVFAVGRRYGYEEGHAMQVARLAEKIFERLAPIYKFPRHWRTLLSAAALLHDVGYHISPEKHHKHSFYLIKHSEITGFSEYEKLVVANTARYHRGAPPKKSHSNFMKLLAEDRRAVSELGAILRLAEGLDRGYESRVKDVKVEKDERKMRLIVISDESCDAELEAARRKKDLFEKAFGVALEIAAEMPRES